MSLYIPDITRSSGALDIAQRRILLCSEPGEGKTYTSITTSPNPIVIDIDKLDAEEVEVVKEAISTDPYTMAVWLRHQV